MRSSNVCGAPVARLMFITDSRYVSLGWQKLLRGACSGTHIDLWVELRQLLGERRLTIRRIPNHVSEN